MTISGVSGVSYPGHTPLEPIPPPSLSRHPHPPHFTVYFREMAGFMSYFGARKDPKASARDAIITLRQQLQMIEKKEDHLQKKIEEELKKAKANAVSNKAGGRYYNH